MNIEKLYPAFKDYLWGGERLKNEYGKRTDASPCAESWELSFHPDGETRLSDGRTLSEALTTDELGSNAAAFQRFPMLVKLIDAKQNLSVQVHPSDAYAELHENSYGKTEMWYIVDADEGAGIYLGFRRDVTEEEYRAAITGERLTELLNFVPVKKGESYFIPSGTVHAIGAGCLILEIQENSNVTYRVYDYGRRDKNGNTRELHVEKALAVSERCAFVPTARTHGVLGASKYFTVRKLTVAGTHRAATDAKSFCAVTCVFGEGSIAGTTIKKGDTFFVPADYGEFELKGNLEVVMTDMRKYYLGIDIGGTFIKGAVVDDRGDILCSDKVPTETAAGAKHVAQNIAALCRSLMKSAALTESDVVGVGMGVPGMIDGASGTVVYANNLGWRDFRIAEKLGELIALPVKIANDANAAALGETKFGSGKKYSSTVLLTLGTGVGGGIVIGGKLLEGNRGAGAELGHSVIVASGEKCTCGRRGCLEAYASATALIRDTKRAMNADLASPMWELGTLSAVNGKTAFDYYERDAGAKRVVDNYIKMLACGIVNIANELRPEAVILGGGVCAQGDNLIVPLQKLVDEEIYAGNIGPQVKIIVAELGNNAGCLGGAALFMD